MNKNHSNRFDELPIGKSVRSQLQNVFLSPKVLIYAAIIILLLLISTINKAQNYPAAFSQVLIANNISNPTNME
ncbi:MAG: hypothetical protein ABI855_17140, partial [Bacteroidota bacterium]